EAVEADDAGGGGGDAERDPEPGLRAELPPGPRRELGFHRTHDGHRDGYGLERGGRRRGAAFRLRWWRLARRARRVVSYRKSRSRVRLRRRHRDARRRRGEGAGRGWNGRGGCRIELRRIRVGGARHAL